MLGASGNSVEAAIKSGLIAMVTFYHC